MLSRLGPGGRENPGGFSGRDRLEHALEGWVGVNMDSRRSLVFLPGQSTIWEMGRAACLRSLSNLGKMSPCLNTLLLGLGLSRTVLPGPSTFPSSGFEQLTV